LFWAPINFTNYKEIDWTVRLFYSIKDNIGTNFSLISSCPASGIYYFKGAPDLLFSKKAASDASLLMSDDDIKLFDLKQGYLSMPKVSVAGLPNAAGQVIAGLHFLSVAKVLKSVMTHRKIPEIMKSRSVLVKRKDTMSLYTLTVNIKGANLAQQQPKFKKWIC